jgi:hypothetical protein
MEQDFKSEPEEHFYLIKEEIQDNDPENVQSDISSDCYHIQSPSPQIKQQFTDLQVNIKTESERKQTKRRNPPKSKKFVVREVTKAAIVNNKRYSTEFSEFQCQICLKYFSRKFYLDYHMELHFQPSTYDCQNCERIFKTKFRFDGHKCVKKSERHFCTFCDKNFSSVDSLTAHVKNNHSEKLNQKIFLCKLCGAKFFHEHKLRVHLKTFVCLQAYHCDYCGKKFDKKRGLKDHIKVHAIYKVECTICNAMVKLSSWRIHTRLKHLKKEAKAKSRKSVKVPKNQQKSQVHKRRKTKRRNQLLEMY